MDKMIYYRTQDDLIKELTNLVMTYYSELKGVNIDVGNRTIKSLKPYYKLNDQRSIDLRDKTTDDISRGIPGRCHPSESLYQTLFESNFL